MATDTAGTPQRCPICGWPMADSVKNGCVPGNCSYRPDDPAEQERIRQIRKRVGGAEQGGNDVVEISMAFRRDPRTGEHQLRRVAQPSAALSAKEFYRHVYKNVVNTHTEICEFAEAYVAHSGSQPTAPDEIQRQVEYWVNYRLDKADKEAAELREKIVSLTQERDKLESSMVDWQQSSDGWKEAFRIGVAHQEAQKAAEERVSQMEEALGEIANSTCDGATVLRAIARRVLAKLEAPKEK